MAGKSPGQQPMNQQPQMGYGEAKFIVQEAEAQLATLMEDDEWFSNKLLRVVRTMFPSDVVPETVTVIRQNEINGTLNSVEFRRWFEEQITHQHARMLEVMDPFTRVAAMGAYSSMDAKALAFDNYSTKFYMAGFNHPGTFSYISGPITYESVRKGEFTGSALGTGKSNTGALFMEMFVANGWRVQTNYDIKDCPPEIKEIHGLRDMMLGSIKNMKEGKFTWNNIDEFTQSISKEYGSAGGWVALKKIMYLLRKVGASMNVITQREMEIPYAIQEMASVHIQKKNKTLMNFRRNNEFFVIKDVPATKLKYDTYYFSPFEIDLDVQGMHNALANAQKGDDQFAIILEYLEEDGLKITKADVQNFAKVGYLSGMTQQEIARWLDWTDIHPNQSTVSRWLDKMGVNDVL
jgi:hypothetical protein